MNYLKLQLLHLTETSRDFWLRQPVQLLKLYRHFGSHNTIILPEKSQQRYSVGLQRRDAQTFRDCWKDVPGNISTTSVDLHSNNIQQTENDVTSTLKEDFTSLHQIAVESIVPKIAMCPVRHVSASPSRVVMSESAYHQVTAKYAVSQISTLHQVTAKNFVPQTSSSYSCGWQLACGYSTSVPRKQHVLQAQSLGSCCDLCPACTTDHALSRIFGLTLMVRFYRGQAHRSSKRIKDSQEKYSGFSSNTDQDSAESESNKKYSGFSSNTDRYSEESASNKLAPFRGQTDLADDRSIDVTQETMNDTDITDQRGITERRKPVDELTLPELSRTSFNIVPYVNRSVTLQNLVRLGVSLDKVQGVPGIAEHLIKSDFERDIVPLLRFLVHVGLEADEIGYVFTANPLLFLESVKDLELRVGYLLHKNFSLKDVAAIVSNAPIVLLMDPVMLDEKLGFLQDVFGLTANEVRQAVMLYPKILPRKKELLAEMKFHMQEFIGFTNSEIKELILKDPKVFVSGKGTLVNRFNYLHNYMQIPHDLILIWPKILRMREYIVKNRHLFLVLLDRAQYDPRKENYVSMQALAAGTDEEFCQNVAKCPVQKFYDFCKTL